eukprot:11226153-Lingulodinium_polyedra.AAC.1
MAPQSLPETPTRGTSAKKPSLPPAVARLPRWTQRRNAAGVQVASSALWPRRKRSTPWAIASSPPAKRAAPCWGRAAHAS